MSECSHCGRRLIRLNSKQPKTCEGCLEIEEWCECEALNRFEVQEDDDEVA